ncbi:MAG TPA: MG2 domain-containing protein [Gemmatimonadaceae bacterium]|nr:MG2 domain-containing protein [Gemmatimonadaceae bacterium]
MPFVFFALLLAALVAALPADISAQNPAPLRVIRVTPAGDASPTSRISVTFDRPIAGSLDRTVDPATVLRIDPAVPGKLEWRDPVTIRLTPSAPLTPGARYTVTVANDFRAMDGSRLAEPHRFTFRAQGPTLLTGSPVAADIQRARHVAPNQRFELVYSAPVDLAKLTAAAYLEFSAGCGGARIVRLRAAGQRRIREDDGWRLREAGGWQRDRSVDSLRRIVQLVPAAALPHGCAGELVAPAEVEDQLPRGYARWGFDTYGDFQLGELRCGSAHAAGRGQEQFCPTGPLTVTFTNPVRGAEVLRRVRILPAGEFTVRDTLSESVTWTLETSLEPHVGYAVVADTAMRDAFGQPLRGNPARGYRTTGFAPSINHPFGRLLVERTGFRTLGVQHVNIDTLLAIVAPVPDSLEARILSRFGWGDDELWSTLLRGASVQRLPVRAARDRPTLTGVRLPAPDATRAHTPALFAVRISGKAGGRDARTDGPTALVQVTNLGVHARVGPTEGAVWVTGVSDGMAKEGASVVLHDSHGRRLATARTDSAGLARLAGWATPAPADGDAEEEYGNFEGYVSVTLGDDRAITAINRWDPDLSPWRFNVYSAWGDQRLPLAGAVFTERGIYRPGERVHAKAIVRDGALGALRVPARGDSIKWLFHDRDEGVLREATAPLSAFGTGNQSLELPAVAAVGQYRIEIQAKRQGKWRSVAQAGYRVAEYRPPEFLVDVNAGQATRLPGDQFTATVQARYLFGAPMGRAEVSWMARQSPVASWELRIPGAEGWYAGESGWWWEGDDEQHVEVFASETDTLDARGERTLSVKLPPPPKGRAARVTLRATVTDVNRQEVGAAATAIVHPAEFYIAAKPQGTTYFWRAGTEQSVGLIAVRPDGQRVAGVRMHGTVVRREWHRVRRERGGISEVVGEWVSDTVARCTVTSAATPVSCSFTPSAGGVYVLDFTATDRGGRTARTSFQRWAAGAEWVPWNDETQFRMDVVPDRTRYSVGDTATVLFASPFTDAEAWITVEREGIIEQRRMRLSSGATTLEFPITEAYAPNAFISIVVTRGRSAPPGPVDDPGRPTIRVGYAELRVTPEVKRLAVALEPLRTEYRPADTARVRIRVRDAAGNGQRSEVTLWAVDEGVLALTGYTTPDPIDLMYRARGLGMRLASNMTSVAPQVPEGEKGRREAGGGGGADGADVLRSRFQTTAFFIGSVVTDAQGNAVATAKLPDNLTTFRIMAVAVTAGDRYGKGESSLLVTRPLLARPALPRFLRPGDEFTAGAVINRRDGTAGSVRVRASATGVTLRAVPERTATLAASRGTEVRFPFLATRADSATFRFDVTGGRDTDAVRVSIPVRPDHHPVAHTIAGVLHDTATVEIVLPATIDAARSRLTLSLGASPLATIRGMRRTLRVYPYHCTEQVLSTVVPLIALHSAGRQAGTSLVAGDAAREIARAVDVLSRRQRVDGGIGYWSAGDWTSPWLSAYSGIVMLDAREAGVAVDSLVLERLAAYVLLDLRGASTVAFTPVANWYERRELRLRDQVAAVDFLSRLGRPEIGAENELLRNAAQLAVEDRARLAEVLARRGQGVAARALMEPTWALVRVEGRHAVLADSLRPGFYFDSRMRPMARILRATLAVDPEHALVGPLVESLAQQGRAERAAWVWNTQDYSSAIAALAEFDRRQQAQGARAVRVRAAGRAILQGSTFARGAGRDSSVALTGLLGDADGGRALRLSLDAGQGDGAIYYYLTVTEVPTAPPVTPEDRGIQVERWYESYDGTTPVTSVTEGDLVRVRLRITVPTTRHFVVVDDALPAGLEAVDLSLRTAAAAAGPGTGYGDERPDHEERERQDDERHWSYGRWDSGWWSPFDHRELRDDRVVYSATILWPGTYTAAYLARATTPGTFIRPPAHAEEMYNPAVHGRSDGGTFVVTPRGR